MMEGASRAIQSEELLAQMGWVRALARGLLSDPGLAEDVAQDAWILATERPPREREGPGLKAWLASVTRTMARQSVRSSRRRVAREWEAARPEAILVDPSVVERGVMQERIARAVMKLDEPYRSTVLRRYLDGLSSAEIAREQGESPATVRKRLSRGLDQLRARLDGEFGGDRSAWCAVLLPLAATGPVAVGVGSSGVFSMAKATTTISLLKMAAGTAVLAGLTYTIWKLAPAGGEGGAAAVAGVAGARPTIDPASRDDPPSLLPSEERTREPEREAMSEKSVLAHGEASSKDQPALDDPAAKLDKLAGSFLTDQPDFSQLADLLDVLGHSAIVDPESVITDPNSGKIEGRVAVPGSVVTARFEITEGDCLISFDWGRGESLRTPFFARDVTLQFHHDEGRAIDPGATVQFHPDTRQDPQDLLAPDEEKRIGWSISYGEKGSALTPLTMSRGPTRGSWRIGHSQKYARVEQPGALTPATYDTWCNLLRPFAH